MKKSATALVSDYLREVTRKKRRSLLGISTLGIAMIHAKIVPTRISMLGVDFNQGNQEALLFMFALVVAYYLAGFTIYGIADFSTWRLNFIEVAIKDTEEHRRDLIVRDYHDESEPDPEEEIHLSKKESQSIATRFSKLYRSSKRWVSLAPVISILRATFDFALPIPWAGYAIYVLTSFR